MYILKMAIQRSCCCLETIFGTLIAMANSATYQANLHPTQYGSLLGGDDGYYETPWLYPRVLYKVQRGRPQRYINQDRDRAICENYEHMSRRFTWLDYNDGPFAPSTNQIRTRFAYRVFCATIHEMINGNQRSWKILEPGENPNWLENFDTEAKRMASFNKYIKFAHRVHLTIVVQVSGVLSTPSFEQGHIWHCIKQPDNSSDQGILRLQALNHIEDLLDDIHRADHICINVVVRIKKTSKPDDRKFITRCIAEQFVPFCRRHWEVVRAVNLWEAFAPRSDRNPRYGSDVRIMLNNPGNWRVEEDIPGQHGKRKIGDWPTIPTFPITSRTMPGDPIQTEDFRVVYRNSHGTDARKGVRIARNKKISFAEMSKHHVGFICCPEFAEYLGSDDEEEPSFTSTSRSESSAPSRSTIRSGPAHLQSIYHGLAYHVPR